MPSDTAGCGHFRIIHPLEILKRNGAAVHVMSPPERGRDGRYGSAQIYSEMFEGANIILIQRAIDPGLFDLFPPADYRRQENIRVIFECDDDLFHLDPMNPAVHRKGAPKGSQHDPQTLNGMRKVIQQCDAVFVSTPELAAAWSHLHRRIYVLPNSIDFSIRPWGIREDHKQVGKPGDIVIGWAGGAHHVGDEEPLVGVVREIVEQYPQVHLAICSNPGISAFFLHRWGFGGLRQGLGGEPHLIPDPAMEGRFSIIGTVPFFKWPFVMSQYDIGLCPLADTQFNRSKSYLRILEYGAHGSPYVAQNIAPFAQFHRETGGVGGFLASGKAQWREALARLIEDAELRLRMGAAVKSVIREQYNTDTVAMRWADAMRETIASQGVSTWTPRERPSRNAPCPCGSGLKHKRCQCYGAWG